MTWQSELPHEHRGEFYLAIDSLPAVEKLNQGLSSSGYPRIDMSFGLVPHQLGAVHVELLWCSTVVCTN